MFLLCSFYYQIFKFYFEVETKAVDMTFHINSTNLSNFSTTIKNLKYKCWSIYLHNTLTPSLAAVQLAVEKYASASIW